MSTIKIVCWGWRSAAAKPSGRVGRTQAGQHPGGARVPLDGLQNEVLADSVAATRTGAGVFGLHRSAAPGQMQLLDADTQDLLGGRRSRRPALTAPAQPQDTDVRRAFQAFTAELPRGSSRASPISSSAAAASGRPSPSRSAPLIPCRRNRTSSVEGPRIDLATDAPSTAHHGRWTMSAGCGPRGVSERKLAVAGRS